MGDKAKLLSIILIILMVISLGLAGVLYTSLQKEQTKSVSLQEELNNVKASQKLTESKLEESRKKAALLETKLEENNNQIETLNKELQQQKTEKEEALIQIQQLKTDIEKQTAIRSDLESKIAGAQDAAKKAQKDLKKLESLKSELEAKIKELEKKTEYVELGKIVVTPESPEAAPEVSEPAAAGEAPAKAVLPKAKPEAKDQANVPAEKTAAAGMEAKVLVVNKDYNFVVLNLGSKDGVRVGDEFCVYHDNKLTGEVKVEKVHDSMAAAGFLSADIKDKINEGDRAIRKK